MNVKEIKDRLPINSKTAFVAIYQQSKVMDAGKIMEEATPDQKDKKWGIFTSNDSDTCSVYNKQMTVCQASAISKILPINYSLHIDRNLKPKPSQPEGQPLAFTFNKQPTILRKENFDSGSDKNLKLTEEELHEQCERILIGLRKNKNSWPFLQPINPILKGAPYYMDIVKEPMDLLTINDKLAEHQYKNVEQFYADIELIIANSFALNKNNFQLCKITTAFQKCFQKLKGELMKKLSSNLKKKNSSSSTKSDLKHPISISEKKQLAMRIRTLPRNFIVQIAEIVLNGPVPDDFQFSVEALSSSQLQKIISYLDRVQSHKDLDIKIAEAEESSFHSDFGS